jgi:hypothetical protein
MHYIAVYCGSSKGKSPIYEQEAKNFARKLADTGFGLVYGGGAIGLMGIIADEMLACGAEVIGVIPQKLLNMEVGHTQLTKLHVVETMHQRKALMSEYASGFVALPGAVGTLEELFEIIVLNQLKYINKPFAFYNINNYYDKLIEFLRHTYDEGFLWKATFDSFFISNEADKIVRYFNEKINY